MGTLLLHNPWVQFYLLYVAALFVACIWDYLRNPPAIQDDSRTPRNEWGRPNSRVTRGHLGGKRFGDTEDFRVSTPSAASHVA